MGKVKFGGFSPALEAIKSQRFRLQWGLSQ